MPAVTCSGSSLTSRSLAFGRITVVMPERFAATIFSRMPPTGSTRPVSDTSPVIATSDAHCRRSADDRSAVVIAMPALGPSFGTAPAGKCRCTSLSAKKLALGRHSPTSASPTRWSPMSHSTDSAWRARRLAIAELSFITSPSCPVMFIEPLPSPPTASLEAVSISSTSPPNDVYARPFATPTGSLSYILSLRKTGTPRYSPKSARRTTTGGSCTAASCAPPPSATAFPTTGVRSCTSSTAPAPSCCACCCCSAGSPGTASAVSRTRLSATFR
mmetsp:Transcript_12113/g.50976  ORF Transcript_12113/g.50976 Transcript_12113/m.50976 type:complete len:273 (-) Transcript_12113:2867-3685(-)